MSNLQFIEQEYHSGRRLRIDIRENGIPYSTMTVNIPHVELSDNEFIMNSTHAAYCADINQKLIDLGYITDTGKVCVAGFQTYTIWRRNKSLSSLFL